jgi:hypothetical protein
MQFLVWLQDTDFSTWTRESDWALFAFLIVHTIGMGFLVGTGIVMDLRVLGVGQRIPLSLFKRFLPLMVCGLITAILSGILLVISYPAKALTNPLFYIKLTIVTTALLLTRTLARRLFASSQFDSQRAPSWARAIAMLCMLLWIAGLTSGKFLAYTNKMLLVYQ